jgi:hypothetical protein
MPPFSTRSGDLSQDGRSQLWTELFERSLEDAMRIVAVAGLIVILGSLAAVAQSISPAPDVSTNPQAVPKISNITGAPQPVPTGKWLTCRTSAQALQGQDRKDQMQLCLEEARLDCLKQAIAQKIVGPERRDFIKTCMTE